MHRGGSEIISRLGDSFDLAWNPIPGGEFPSQIGHSGIQQMFGFQSPMESGIHWSDNCEKKFSGDFGAASPLLFCRPPVGGAGVWAKNQLVTLEEKNHTPPWGGGGAILSDCLKGSPLI